MSIQKHAFEGVLNYLATKESPKWFMYLQASQFELNGFKDSVNNGMLCLNLGPMATRDMQCLDDCVTFNSRKHGIEQHMSIPYTAIMFIQDPDNTGVQIPWPYYLDHGDDFGAEPDNVVQLTPREAWDTANRISKELAGKNYIDLPELKTHSDGAKVIDLIDFRNRLLGDVDLFEVAAKAQRYADKAKAETPLTLEEKVGLRKWVVIEGGNQKPKASLPFIDEVYQAKRDKREREAKLVNPDIVETQKALRSDGNDGTSVFFPDLDVSKCYFPTKRIERPSWLTVITGGKNVAA